MILDIANVAVDVAILIWLICTRIFDSRHRERCEVETLCPECDAKHSVPCCANDRDYWNEYFQDPTSPDFRDFSNGGDAS